MLQQTKQLTSILSIHWTKQTTSKPIQQILSTTMTFKYTCLIIESKKQQVKIWSNICFINPLFSQHLNTLNYNLITSSFDRSNTYWSQLNQQAWTIWHRYHWYQMSYLYQWNTSTSNSKHLLPYPNLGLCNLITKKNINIYKCVSCDFMKVNHYPT